MFIYAALILCTILPSQVAFTSLPSASGIPLTASYGLIALLRLFITPDEFKGSKFNLGPFAKWFYAATALFNAILFAVQSSPFFFPVTAETFNFVSLSKHSYYFHRTYVDLIFFSFNRQAVVILVAITIFAILSWRLIPADNWLPRERIMKVFNAVEEEPIGST
jgi:translation initiation factor 5B